MLLTEDIGDKSKQFEQILERVSKYLNVMNFFLNSKIFMAEMCEH